MLRFRYHGIQANLRQNCHQPDTLLRVTTRVIHERTYEGLMQSGVGGVPFDATEQTVEFDSVINRAQHLHGTNEVHTRHVRLTQHFPPLGTSERLRCTRCVQPNATDSSIIWSTKIGHREHPTPFTSRAITRLHARTRRRARSYVVRLILGKLTFLVLVCTSTTHEFINTEFSKPVYPGIHLRIGVSTWIHSDVLSGVILACAFRKALSCYDYRNLICVHM